MKKALSIAVVAMGVVGCSGAANVDSADEPVDPVGSNEAEVRTARCPAAAPNLELRAFRAWSNLRGDANDAARAFGAVAAGSGSFITQSAGLDKKKSGVCTYASEGGPGEMTARLYTKAGKDWLQVRFPHGTGARRRDLVAYLEVSSYDNDEIAFPRRAVRLYVSTMVNSFPDTVEQHVPIGTASVDQTVVER